MAHPRSRPRGPWQSACTAVTWTAFALDYITRLVLSEQRWTFVKRNLIDLAVVVLPILRPLRLLRLIVLLNVLNRRAGASLRSRCGTRGTGQQHRQLRRRALLGSQTTVVYGDQFPTTGTGRFIAAGLMLAGIALLGVVTASFASWLIEGVTEIEVESQAATRRDVKALTAQVAALQDALAARDLICERPDQHDGDTYGTYDG